MNTIRETCRILSIRERTLRRLVKEGRIPFTRIGRTKYLSVAYLRDLLQVYGALNDMKDSYM